jgi:hypothetical protein
MTHSPQLVPAGLSYALVGRRLLLRLLREILQLGEHRCDPPQSRSALLLNAVKPLVELP